jgi:hypothetical protein
MSKITTLTVLTPFEQYVLIHRFLGNTLKGWINETNFKNHFFDDWDSLMEVVSAILVICLDKGQFSEINSKRVELFKDISIFSTKAQVHSACIQFIKWYNQQTK